MQNFNRDVYTTFIVCNQEISQSEQVKMMLRKEILGFLHALFLFWKTKWETSGKNLGDCSILYRI